jgi:putative transposase
MVGGKPHGKDQKEVRYPVQNPGVSEHCSGHPYGGWHLPRVPTPKVHGGSVEETLLNGATGSSPGFSGQGLGEGKREAQGQGRRTYHGARPAKKNAGLGKAATRRQLAHRHFQQLGSVSKACRAANLAPSTYYYKPKEKALDRAKADSDTRDLIEKVQSKFPFFGYRRIHRWLERKCGVTVNEKRIRRIMQEYGLKALIWRGFKVKTTDSSHGYGIAPNLLPGRQITGINQVWVADITYIRISTGFMYLAAILDLYSRKVVGWVLSQSIDGKLCLGALEDAIGKRNPLPGLIHHSDRGVQYACELYRQRLAEHGILPSMSAKGHCYDNAFMESWFKTLKAEEVYLTEYETMEDVLQNIPHFIEAVYNEKRLHSSLGYFSPEEFEHLAAAGLLEKHGIQPVIQL